MNSIEEIREIYKQCFGDDAEFENLLFETCSENLKTLEINGETVSFLFALPCEIRTGYNTFNAIYIFAAATKESRRKKGYMEALLESVKQEFGGALILRPATESLITYYKKFRFSEFTAQDTEEREISIVPTKEFKALSEKADKTDEGEFTAMALNFGIDLNGSYFPYSMP